MYIVQLAGHTGRCRVDFFSREHPHSSGENYISLLFYSQLENTISLRKLFLVPLPTARVTKTLIKNTSADFLPISFADFLGERRNIYQTHREFFPVFPASISLIRIGFLNLSENGNICGI
jgi:hypothetical protein